MSIFGLMQIMARQMLILSEKKEFILKAHFINTWYHLLVGLPSNPYIRTLSFEIVLMLISTPKRGRDMRLGCFPRFAPFFSSSTAPFCKHQFQALLSLSLTLQKEFLINLKGQPSGQHFPVQAKLTS